MDNLPLNPDAAAVNDTDLPKPLLNGLIQVFFDHDMDLLRLKRMKVDGILDGNVMHNESI